MTSKPASISPATASTPPYASAPKVTSDALLGAGKQLVILHNGREYVLRLTQAGKLILTA